jgi:hypothetical protein
MIGMTPPHKSFLFMPNPKIHVPRCRCQLQIFIGGFFASPPTLLEGKIWRKGEARYEKEIWAQVARDLGCGFRRRPDGAF